jgi:hypothetical protein
MGPSPAVSGRKDKKYKPLHQTRMIAHVVDQRMGPEQPAHGIRQAAE